MAQCAKCGSGKLTEHPCPKCGSLKNLGPSQRYTPTYEEWRRASPYQRRNMTWPREVLRQLARERP